jgi:hypothetical protein
MSVIPTVTQDGVGVISAGQLNAYTFSCYNTGVLRSIVGQTGMTAYLQGTNVPGDGGQGLFYWNYSSVAPDNGTTIIVPSGVVYGAWIMVAQVMVGNLISTTLAASTSYTNDAAAAAGGVVVGQFYRNGSVLQIRVT